MDVVEACSSVLSNQEVLHLLKRNNIGNKKQTNLATITYETTAYLNSTPAASTNLEALEAFLQSIKERKFELSKLEKIQIANHMPQNETELLLIVDNLEDRFTEEQRADLLRLIAQTKEHNEESLRKKAKI